MHVLHVETGRHLYGGPRQVLMLLDGLAGTGALDPRLYRRRHRPAAQASGHEVATRGIGGDLDVGAIPWLGRLVRECRPDVLHAHSRRGADFFTGLAALGSVPAVLTRRVDNPDTPVIGRLRYQSYDRVVAISQAVAVRLAADGVPARKLRVIRSAVDVAACQPAWPRERFLETFGLHAAQRVVAVVAQLIPRKGHGLLLDAWPLIRHRCGDAHLLVFGTGPLEAELRARAGLGGTVSFAGFRPDLREFLGYVDLLVHPALREGLGVSLLEAQAAGVPVVAFAAGGVTEAIVDGATGLLVPPGDSVALVDAVTRPAGRSQPASAVRCRGPGAHDAGVRAGADGGRLSRPVPRRWWMAGERLSDERLKELADRLAGRWPPPARGWRRRILYRRLARESPDRPSGLFDVLRVRLRHLRRLREGRTSAWGGIAAEYAVSADVASRSGARLAGGARRPSPSPASRGRRRHARQAGGYRPRGPANPAGVSRSVHGERQAIRRPASGRRWKACWNGSRRSEHFPEHPAVLRPQSPKTAPAEGLHASRREGGGPVRNWPGLERAHFRQPCGGGAPAGRRRTNNQTAPNRHDRGEGVALNAVVGFRECRLNDEGQLFRGLRT